MEEKNDENFEKVIKNIKITEKKSNRLADDKQRKKKRKKEKKQKEKSENKEKKQKNKKKIVAIILIVLTVIIGILGVVIGTYVYKADGDITTAALNMAADVLGEDDPIFVLVLGISEDIEAELTDTIILAGYNPDSQKTFMLSIPRDTFVGKNEETAGGFDKINAAYRKGYDKTVEAVEKLTGIKIDHYVLVKNSALPAIVSAIGEVEFDVPIDMNYDDPTQNLHIHLKKGVQMIDGDEAEQLLRFRHNNDGSSYPIEYGDNDFGRMRTQREFIKAVASQLVKGSNLSNVKAIASAVFANVTTDMSLPKIISYAPSAIKIDVNGIRMEQLPGFSDKINDLWFYIKDNKKTYDLVNELLTELQLDEKEMEKFYTPTDKVNKPRKKPVEEKPEEDKKEEEENDLTKCKHENAEETIITKPTCLTDGQKELKCECGNIETVKIPATDHKIKKVETVSGNKKTIVETCTNEDCDYEKTKTETIESETPPKEDNKEDNEEDNKEEPPKDSENTEKPSEEKPNETPETPTPPTPTPPSVTTP